jgi:hypothetical protein
MENYIQLHESSTTAKKSSLIFHGKTLWDDKKHSIQKMEGMLPYFEKEYNTVFLLKDFVHLIIILFKNHYENSRFLNFNTIGRSADEGLETLISKPQVHWVPNPMISDKINRTQEYKACVARDCTNEAKYQLKIFFAKNPGWFCGSCKKYFEDLDLVEDVPSK